MLTQAQVQRYANESGLRDIMIAEKEIVLTYLIQLLSERGILDRLAFKGGTCLRKMFLGAQGRFSTDLDFTGIEEHNHEEIIVAMMEAFEQPYHDIQFAIPGDAYYETRDGLSWGVNPTYMHAWNRAGSEIKLQISRREIPTLPTERMVQVPQSYFRFFPFTPTDVVCLALPEILAEKIRACYQRNKARDIFDLGMFATRPLDQVIIRSLVVLKLWQARDSFDPTRLMRKFEGGREFDWDDLRQLTNRAITIDRDGITRACVRGFAFLADLTKDEQILAADKYQRERAVAERIRDNLHVLRN
ncbi:MAG TPA: nucleotidyl transferase AbiEii/AbiGii toxin family protein [Terracidiphilus sp.]|nr:nucleotidyl transferase AbiEii/AbiGii toxin family protein [Terracidiphilus sp.]